MANNYFMKFNVKLNIFKNKFNKINEYKIIYFKINILFNLYSMYY